MTRIICAAARRGSRCSGSSAAGPARRSPVLCNPVRAAIRTPLVIASGRCGRTRPRPRRGVTARFPSAEGPERRSTVAFSDVGVIAGAVSTSIFVASYLPMLIKAARSRDLSSYSVLNLLLANVGNGVHSIYVFSLPAGPLWALHSFYLLSSALMLFWWARFRRRNRAGTRIGQRGAPGRPARQGGATPAGRPRAVVPDERLVWTGSRREGRPRRGSRCMARRPRPDRCPRGRAHARSSCPARRRTGSRRSVSSPPRR